MRTIREAENLRGKRVLVRVDWNVPVENGMVRDDFRITASLPTLEYLRKNGAKIIVISHFESKDSSSIRPVYNYVKNLWPLSFCGDVADGVAHAAIDTLEEGETVLLENLRRNPGEKDNSEEFAKKLASLGDVYVNEAFSASHRTHASIVGIPKFLPSYAGLRFSEEVLRLSSLSDPKKPFLFILGGAKFDTKLPLIERFITVADTVFVGGALAHNFFKIEGKDIGDSLVSEGEFDLTSLLGAGKIELPRDLVIKGGDGIGVDTIDHVGTGDMIVDAGPKTIDFLREKIANADTILWNGPLGNYELGFKEGTMALAKVIAESGKESILGGGDTLAAIQELDLYEKFTFVSTGGGAMLNFLSSGTLPGVKALE